ncbi:hypothetical protein GGH92_000094 [Coemansia sp. RSA 2673]|nr:hypothetical protein GGH92_000094 [Coemansia sp. RSA 2673]
MQRAKEEDGSNPGKIVILYIAPKGFDSRFYAFKRSAITNLNRLLQEEERSPYYRREGSNADHLIRTQFGVNFEWVGSLNKNTPDITVDCKYIIVRSLASADMSDEDIRRMIKSAFVGCLL